jgi:hypothetical protein
MRLKYFIAALAVLVLSFGCAKLPGVTKVGGDGGAGKDGATVAKDDGVGVYYALPLTVVKVEMPLSLKYFVKDVDKNAKNKIPGVIPVFTKATITTTSVPDPDHVYKYSLKGRNFNDMSFMIKLSETGQLVALGSGSVNRSSDVAAQFIRYAASLCAGWITGGIATPLPDVEGTAPTLERRKIEKTDIFFDPLATGYLEQPRHPVSQLEVVESKECAEQNQFKNKAIDTKKRILLGEMLKNAQGDAIRARLEGLDALVKKIDQQCADNQTKDYSLSFYVQPVQGAQGASFKAPVLYVGEKSGYVRYMKSPYEVVAGVMAQNYSGLEPGTDEYKKQAGILYDKWLEDNSKKGKERRSNFVFVEVEAKDGPVDNIRKNRGGEPTGEQALYYRVPGNAKVSLTYKGEELVSSDVSLAQYGVIAAAPQGFYSKEASFDARIYYNSGGISDLSINTTGHGAKDVKPFVEAPIDVINAELKQQQQREAEAKATKEAAAKSASIPAATPAAP